MSFEPTTPYPDFHLKGYSEIGDGLAHLLVH